MDTVTGQTWHDLTGLIRSNFQEADSCSFTSNFRDMLTWLFKNNPDIKEAVFMSGSAVEGGMFSGLEMKGGGGGVGGGVDIDLMYHFCYYKLNPHEQATLFKDIAGAPGHITIDITNNLIKMLFDHLNVVEESNGRVFVSAGKCRRLAREYMKSQNLKGFVVDEAFDPEAGKASIPLNLGGNNPNYRELMTNMHSKDSFPASAVGELYDTIREETIKTGTDESNLQQTEATRVKLFNQFNVDVVPAIECELWPIDLAEEWITRKRRWPPKIVIGKIVQDGYHVVPKSSPGGNAQLEWRISFSKAELTLAECRTDVQKKCFYIFKTLFNENMGQQNIITTYHLKTIMMWDVEQKPPLYWKDENLGKCVFGLLDNLHHAVVTGELKHYFIPQNNLLGHVHKALLANVGKQLSTLRNAISFLNRQTPFISETQAENVGMKRAMTSDNAKMQFGKVLEGVGGKMNELIVKLQRKATERKQLEQQGKKETAAESMNHLTDMLNDIFTLPGEVLEEQNLYNKSEVETAKDTVSGVGAAVTNFLQSFLGGGRAFEISKKSDDDKKSDNVNEEAGCSSTEGNPTTEEEDVQKSGPSTLIEDLELD